MMGRQDLDSYGRGSMLIARPAGILALSLAVLTLAVYWQVQHHEFLVWDDYEYVVENPHVRNGLSLENVIWAFTSSHASNWHPVTWLSHMLDCELYGLNPAGHHLNSLILHVINTVLLFALFARMTRAFWQSAFVAAVFAIHPLHVESVAWVSERKDVLSTFFFLLTCLAYHRYTVRPKGAAWYAACLGLYTLGLATKPMLITLPLLLLLMDYWPLRRTRLLVSDDRPCSPARLSDLVKEKWPFFVLAGVSSLITFSVSKADLATASLHVLPLESRFGNALVSYVSYVYKSFWPVDLAFFYPHPLETLSAWKIAGASILLGSVSLVALIAGRKCPYFIMGWLWYGVTLLPVIGLVQVGSQAMADRYTYVSLIGISIMVAWGVSGLLKAKLPRAAALLLASAVILLLSMLTSTELRHWRNSETLFTRALQVTTGNYTAHYQLGNEMMRQGRMEPAVHHFSEAVKIRPDHLPARHNLGAALAAQGRFVEAIDHYLAALEVQPGEAGILSRTGDAYLGQGNFKQAIAFYSEALGLDPSQWTVHNNVGFALLKQGMTREAIVHFEEALRLNPDDRKARHNLHIARKNIEGTKP